MTSLKSPSGALALVLAVVFLAARSPAETYVGSNVDSRVLVGLEADPESVQALMPEGWMSVPFPEGPLAGANLLLVLIDGMLEMDPEGRPLDPPSRRAAVLVGLGKQDDTVQLYVLSMMTTVPERDPYGVGTSAEIRRIKSLDGPANGARVSSDEWRIMPPEGGELVFTLEYTTGRRSWGPGESYPHSAATPEFSRIYRYEQMADLVASTALGIPSSGTFSLAGTGAAAGGVFADTPRIVAVIDVPVYVRRVFLP